MRGPLGAGFLKVGKCIDVDTWEIKRYHTASIYKDYYFFYIFEADPLSSLMTNCQVLSSTQHL